jgi:ethanolamine utilization protein EutN
MRTGVVVGRLWATKRIEDLPTGGLLEIELEGAHSESIVAFDPLGCGSGERVLVVFGSSAARFFLNPRTAVDAVVIGIVDPDTSN